MTPSSRGTRMLALDLGGESGRGIVGRFDGERLAIEEVHRFQNEPVMLAGTLVWDFPYLFRESLTAIRRAVAGGPLGSIGVDGWGVDFGLLDGRDRLMTLPVHYRDRRTEGLVQVATSRVPEAEIYSTTGIQFMEINTLYQLMALVRDRDPVLTEARTLLLIPDLVLRFLSGSAVTEYTNATTTQCLDLTTGDWARDLLSRLGVPDHILAPVVQPGTILGTLLPEVADDVGAARARIVAPATHDTASAVATIPMTNPSTTAFVSSGTWSLVGLMVDEACLGPAARDGNLSNEGGLDGHILLLRSGTGLWLLQQCRAALARAGLSMSHAALLEIAARAPGRSAFVDPDDPRFFRAGDLPSAVRAFCAETGQPPPGDAGTLVRVLLESLALSSAWTIHLLEAASGRRVEAVHVVGGGVRNQLLCQLIADATGLPVHAGPVESAAIGNLVTQALASGLVGTLDEGRQLVARSFPVATYEPQADWREERERFARVRHLGRSGGGPAAGADEGRTDRGQPATPNG